MGIFLVGGGSPWWPWSGQLVDLVLRHLLAPHLPICHPSHHRDNVTAPHGRPNLRIRLHFRHSLEGGPRKFLWTCGDLRKKIRTVKIEVLSLWSVTPCIFVGGYLLLGETCFFYFLTNLSQMPSQRVAVNVTPMHRNPACQPISNKAI